MYIPALPLQGLVTLLVGGLAVAYFALWACAPATTVRPDLPMAKGQNVGIGAALSQGRSIRRSEPCRDFTGGTSGGCAAGQVWVHLDGGEGVSGGLVGFAGETSGIGLGPYMRLHMLRDPSVRVSLELQGGFLWLAAGVPVAVRIFDELWVYTEPSIGLRTYNVARLPIGLAFDFGHLRLHVEGGVGAGGDFMGSATRDPIIAYGTIGTEVTF